MELSTHSHKRNCTEFSRPSSTDRREQRMLFLYIYTQTHNFTSLRHLAHHFLIVQPGKYGINNVSLLQRAQMNGVRASHFFLTSRARYTIHQNCKYNLPVIRLFICSFLFRILLFLFFFVCVYVCLLPSLSFMFVILCECVYVG